MRKYILTIIMSVLATIIAQAQFNAYQYGADVVRRQQEKLQQQQQQAYNSGAGTTCYIAGQQAIANGNYALALKNFKDGIGYNNIPSYEALGLCYELGVGCERNLAEADKYYRLGAEKNSNSCRNALNRINSNGHYPASYRSTFITNVRNNFNSQYGGAYSAPSQNNNVNADPYPCSVCNATGVCNGCRGTGYAYGTTRCNMCYGGTKCKYCGGKGWRK